MKIILAHVELGRTAIPATSAIALGNTARAAADEHKTNKASWIFKAFDSLGESLRDGLMMFSYARLLAGHG